MLPALSCAIAPWVPPKFVPVGSIPHSGATSYVHSPFPVTRTLLGDCAESRTLLSACTGIAELMTTPPQPARNVRRDRLSVPSFMECSLQSFPRVLPPCRTDTSGAIAASLPVASPTPQ